MDNSFEKEVFEINKKFASKKEIKNTLEGCLDDITKVRLGDLATLYDISGRSKMNKEEMIQELLRNILNKDVFNENIESLTEQELSLMEKLVKSSSENTSDMLFREYFNLYRFGIVFTYYKNNEVCMVVPNEIKELFNGLDLNSLKSEKQRFEIIEKYITVFSNVYGIFEKAFLIECFNEENDDKLTLEELNGALINYKKFNGTIEFEDNRVFNECIFEYEDGVEALEDARKNKEYLKMDRQMIEHYSNTDNLYNSEAHIRLEEFLVKLCQSEDVGAEVFFNICFDLRNDGADPESVAEELIARGITIKNKQPIKELMKLMLHVSNNTRKWANKGYTPTEMMELSMEKLKKKALVGRNDPCPCGSGKKYKKCCGN
ncbi:MAG: YecA family protein [Clostridium sp.]